MFNVVKPKPRNPGWVYVLTNPCLPGLVKIGQTGNTAEKRARQLMREYGVPLPFGVASRHATPDREAVELIAHRMLTDCRLPASELFRCSVPKARRTVEAAILASIAPLPLSLRFRLWLGRRTAPRLWRGRRSSSGDALIMAAAVAFVLLFVLYKPDMPHWFPRGLAHFVRVLELR
jgi:T5orf172 domain